MGLTDRQINGVFRRLQNDTPGTIEWLDQSFLAAGMKNGYKEVPEKEPVAVTHGLENVLILEEKKWKCIVYGAGLSVNRKY